MRESERVVLTWLERWLTSYADRVALAQHVLWNGLSEEEPFTFLTALFNELSHAKVALDSRSDPPLLHLNKHMAISLDALKPSGGGHAELLERIKEELAERDASEVRTVIHNDLAKLNEKASQLLSKFDLTIDFVACFVVIDLDRAASLDERRRLFERKKMYLDVVTSKVRDDARRDVMKGVLSRLRPDAREPLGSHARSVSAESARVGAGRVP